MLNILAILLLLASASAEIVCTRHMAPLTLSHSGVSSAYGKVTSNSQYASKYAAWKAFSDNHVNYWVSGLYDSPTWIAYEFTTARRVRAYRFHFANGPSLRTRAPKHFQLQVKIGGSWVTVDERCCETNWAGAEERTFKLSNDAVGTHFRIMFFDDNDSRTNSKIIVISMYRIQFLGVPV